MEPLNIAILIQDDLVSQVGNELGVTRDFIRSLPQGSPKRMILTNERVDAATALRIGLVEEVVPKGQALEAATRMADRVATLSPRAVAHCKALIHNARNGIARRQGLMIERELFVELFDHGDRLEGVNAFLEKRKPEWKND